MQLARASKAFATLFILCLPVAGKADQISGTWTGSVEARINYYLEASTRVMGPALTGTLASPNGTRVQAAYLMDSITSASLASGVLIDREFTERRHEVRLGVRHEFQLGRIPLDLGLRGRFSYEPDYSSRGIGADASLFLNRRATVLRLSTTYFNDDVGKILRGGQRVGPDGRDLSNRGRVGSLQALVLGSAFEQALSPSLYGQIGYDLGVLSGYLANPYRRIAVEGVLVDEQHPDLRVRHTLHGRIAWYLRRSRSSLHFAYRAYFDSWEVAALTPEVRFYQEFGPFTQVRLRYRHYRQTRSFFYSNPGGYSLDDEFISGDPKMSAFHSNMMGGQVRFQLGFLDQGPLGFLAGGAFNAGFDYIINTNRFGNGVIAQTGLFVPF